MPNVKKAVKIGAAVEFLKYQRFEDRASEIEKDMHVKIPLELIWTFCNTEKEGTKGNNMPRSKNIPPVTRY